MHARGRSRVSCTLSRCVMYLEGDSRKFRYVIHRWRALSYVQLLRSRTIDPTRCACPHWITSTLSPPSPSLTPPLSLPPLLLLPEVTPSSSLSPVTVLTAPSVHTLPSLTYSTYGTPIPHPLSHQCSCSCLHPRQVLLTSTLDIASPSIPSAYSFAFASTFDFHLSYIFNSDFPFVSDFITTSLPL